MLKNKHRTLLSQVFKEQPITRGSPQILHNTLMQKYSNFHEYDFHDARYHHYFTVCQINLFQTNLLEFVLRFLGQPYSRPKLFQGMFCGSLLGFEFVQLIGQLLDPFFCGPLLGFIILLSMAEKTHLSILLL